ncbi:BMP family protein [uncultured Trichococcus sp.]|uniref:BMP family lipoprotein n=1 Tax=uncultured Trichococcus sp. TaxID=189665 RepID=UPI0029C99A3E|nr:BMP family protein [uncultured Trichococcus sp.]
MKKQKYVSLLALGLSVSTILAACGGNGDTADSSATGSGTAGGTEDNFTIAMVTDVGGVDDKSFNQSAWEGLVAWGEENGKEKGIDGYDYIQSNADSEFVTNLNTAVNSNFDLVFGIGYKLKSAMQDVATQNPDTMFAIIDDVIEGENTVSVSFKDNEAAFLAGVAAAKTTKTNQLGFIGGQESVVIDRFEAGFVAGAQSVNPEIDVKVEYVGSFGDAAGGKSKAAAMYASGIDVIYQAAGDSGNGVFSEAKDIVKADPSKEIWVIGVDRDQTEEGLLTLDDGTERNLTLTSTLKGVGTAAKDIATLTMNGEFPAGEVLTFGLAEEGVELTEGQLSADALEAVAKAKTEILEGTLVVPESPEN